MSHRDYNDGDLEELRNLLIKTEKEQIRKIEKRLDDPMIRAKEISRCIPEAISFSLIKGDNISHVLKPVIDASIKLSVKNDPEDFAEAISPALGPGIRRSITSIIMGMIQSLNNVLNHSFSIQGIKWRLEAFKSHRQFAEIVLLHTLVYQVEQIFLIHIKSGLVLEHVVAHDIISQDPDLVSGMLTAIQDFVKDSFDTGTNEVLDALQMGSDRTIWIEHGEHAMIAAVIRGTPPLDLRTKYRELLEEIHIKSGMALEDFDGDPLPFSIFREKLKGGLQFKEKQEKKRISPVLALIFIIVLSISCIWGFNTFKVHKAWNQYISRLKNQKGVIILSVLKQGNKYQLFGLRDPMIEYARLLPDKREKNIINVTGHWKTYYCLDPEFILKRARKILKPPRTVKFSLSGSILSASGKASLPWIKKFRRIAPAVPGITEVNDKFIKNIGIKKLNTALKKLVGIKVYFKTNRTEFIKGQEKILARILKLIKKIEKIQLELNTNAHILIIGHTDSSGSERVNLRLSRNRALKVFNFLIISGVDPAFITTVGIGNKMIPIKENHKKDPQYNRVVTFKTFYNNSGHGRHIK